MSFDSISTLNKNKIYAPIITGVAILVAIIAAAPAYSSYNEAGMELDTAKTALDKSKQELSKLRAQSDKIADPNSPLAQNVAKIAKEFNSSEILETIMVNNFTAPSAALAGLNSNIAIENITLDKGAKEPSGIYRGTVNMTVKAANPEMIMGYLDYLTSKTPYYFSLNTLNLPIDTNNTQSGAEVSIPVTLGMYYYP